MKSLRLPRQHSASFNERSTCEYYCATASDNWLRRVSIASLALFFLAQIAYNFVDIDIWHQMALIRESLAAGRLLHADPFAYTPTLNPWIDHEWGAGVVAYFLTSWFGGRAILFVKFLAAYGTGLLCWACSKKSGADFRFWIAFAPLAIFLAHLGFFAAVRAQVYSFFFVALLIYCWHLEREQARRWMILWLLVFPLWVNLHGGFVVGIGLMTLHAIEERLRGRSIRWLVLALLGMLGEVLLTPYRIAYLSYLRRALFMARPFAPEWRPILDLGLFWILCFVAALALVVYSVSETGFRKVEGLLPFAAAAVEGALHRKLLPIFAVIWLCYAPAYFQNTPVGSWFLAFIHQRRRFVMAVFSVLGCASLIAAIPLRPWQLSVPQPLYPVGPVAYLAEQKFVGNVMSPFRLGAYVSWKLFPRVKVSLDSRYEETFSNQVVEEIFSFYDARLGWKATLEAYPTDIVLAPRENAISEKMPETGWRRVYRDPQFDLYARPGIKLPQREVSSGSLTGAFP